MNRPEEKGRVLIGLTGNIATGKSTVAEMLAHLGAFAIDADKVAHRMMRPGTKVHARVVETFGSRILSDGGDIDRRSLGELVFTDDEALRQLEAIVHPATLEAIESLVCSASADVVVIEAIKLVESGLADRCDSVWVTTCRREQQIERVRDARGLSRAEARQRVEAQPSQEIHVARADVVIDNSGSLSETWRQVLAAWKDLVGAVEDSAPPPLGIESS